MHDEPPAPQTTVESTDDRLERDGESTATEPAPLRSRDGVDPPDGDDPDENDRDESDPDEAPLASRLERLRLWRTLATLAVVVARLIRSL